MKKLIIIPFLLISFLSFSQGQGSEIKFVLINRKPTTSDETTNLKLPLKLSFSKESNGFNTRTIEFKNSGDQTLTGKLVFGNDVSKNEDGSFTFVIENDKKTNPGEVLIEDKKVNLFIDNQKFELEFDTTLPKDKLQKSDDYVAGYVALDALKIVDENTSPSTIKRILKAYGVDDSTIETNVFLKEKFAALFDDNNIQGSSSSILSSIGNTDVTYFAAGLARFLAERTKEELNEAFFVKMKEHLNAYPELKTVFPKTSSFLNVIETYSYASIIQVLKESFETDVQNLPENLYEIKKLTASDCSSELNKTLKNDCDLRMKKLSIFFNTQEGRWIGLGLFTVKEAVNTTNPANLLKSIAESTDLKDIKDFSKSKNAINDYNVATSIELGNFLSQSLLSKDDKQVWINSEEINSLFKTKDAFKVYLGLLLSFEQRKVENVKIEFFKNDTTTTMTFGGILLETHTNYDKYKPQITALIKNIHETFTSANNAVKKMIWASDKSIEVNPQALYDYYKTFTASLKPIISSSILKSIVKKDFGVKYDIIEQYLDPSVDIAYHIATKKYSAAIFDAVLLLDNIKSPAFEKPITKSFIKYGTLISTIASAQSSDEVKKALEASVLPVGSSSIKRKSAWSISVNGYVGGYYGLAHSTTKEIVKNVSTNKIDTVSKDISYRTFGLYAPIGLSFNRGFKCGWGVSLTAQVVDLGAMVNFYLTEGDKASLPTDFKVKLSDILSPGLHLAINFPKTPLTLMGGYQYVPALNTSSQISSQTLSPIAWRCQIGIVVDIPLYNLKVWDFNK